MTSLTPPTNVSAYSRVRAGLRKKQQKKHLHWVPFFFSPKLQEDWQALRQTGKPKHTDMLINTHSAMNQRGLLILSSSQKAQQGLTTCCQETGQHNRKKSCRNIFPWEAAPLSSKSFIQLLVAQVAIPPPKKKKITSDHASLSLMERACASVCVYWSIKLHSRLLCCEFFISYSDRWIRSSACEQIVYGRREKRCFVRESRCASLEKRAGKSAKANRRQYAASATWTTVPCPTLVSSIFPWENEMQEVEFCFRKWFVLLVGYTHAARLQCSFLFPSVAYEIESFKENQMQVGVIFCFEYLTISQNGLLF